MGFDLVFDEDWVNCLLDYSKTDFSLRSQKSKILSNAPKSPAP